MMSSMKSMSSVATMEAVLHAKIHLGLFGAMLSTNYVCQDMHDYVILLATLLILFRFARATISLP